MNVSIGTQEHTMFRAFQAVSFLLLAIASTTIAVPVNGTSPIANASLSGGVTVCQFGVDAEIAPNGRHVLIDVIDR